MGVAGAAVAVSLDVKLPHPAELRMRIIADNMWKLFNFMSHLVIRLNPVRFRVPY